MASLDKIEFLLEQYEPQVRSEFMDAIRDVTSNTILVDVIRRLEAGDLEGAIASIDAPPAVFNPLVTLAVASIFAAAGSAVVQSLPRVVTSDGVRLVPRFDNRTRRATTYQEQRSTDLTSRLSDEIATVARQTFSEGVPEGRSADKLVLDVVGRISRQRNKREGGMIGLTPQLATWVRSARKELSGNTDGYSAYLNRRLRDARFDGIVNRAATAGEPLDAKRVDAIVGRYADTLLKFRASVLSHAETLESSHAGQVEGMQQLVESGSVPPDSVRKTWRISGLPNTRDSHQDLNGTTVYMNEPFRARGGNLMYPGDRSLGADASEIINCRCHAVYGLSYKTTQGQRRQKIG